MAKINRQLDEMPRRVSAFNLLTLDPGAWRGQVLQLGLLTTVLLGALVYVPSVWTAVQESLWGVVIVDTVALISVIALYFARTIPYRVRAGAFSFVLYGLGAWLLFEVGPISQIYLLGFSIVATVFLGLRTGLLTVGLNAITLLGMGVLGFSAPEMVIIGREMTPLAWTAVALNFLVVNTILVVLVGAVLKALETAASRERETREALEEEMQRRAGAEESRAALESRLAATLESMTDAFYMLDHEWRYAYINSEAERILMRPRAELLGKKAYEEYPDFAKGNVGRQFQRTMKDRVPLSFEEYDQTRDIWYEVHTFPSDTGLAVYFRDITERKRVDEALRASEHRFRSVFNQQFQFMAILSPEGRVLEVNDLPLEVGGLTRGEVVGELFWEAGWWRDLPELRAEWPERLAKAASTDGPIVAENAFQDAAGEIRLAHAAITAVHNETGALEWFIVQATDITKQRRMEEEARRSASLLRIASELARLGGWAVEIPSYAMSWSDEVRAIHEVPGDYTPTLEEGIKYYAPEWRETIAKAFEDCATKGVPYDLELEIITAKRRRLWVRAVGRAERDAQGVITRVHGAFQDISEMKRAEAERQALAERLTMTLESITDAFFTLDQEWRFTFLNREAERLLRRTRQELLGCVVWDEFPEAVDTTFQHEYSRAVSERITVEFEEYFEPLETWFEVHAYPTGDGLAVYFRDITERKRADDELHAAKELLERTFESLEEAVLLVEKEGRTIVRCNPAAEKVFGYSMEEMAGRPTQFLHVDRAHHEEFGERSSRALARGEAFHGEFQMRRKDGTLIDTEHTVSALRDENGEMLAVVSVVRDVTTEKRAVLERANLEEQLRQSQKMEAIGRLAGGVAHDFNNMLGVILGHAELMEMADGLPEDSREDLREIITAARRSSDLTRQLLAFARKQTIAPELLDINHTIESMLKMLRRLLGEDVELAWKPGDGAGAVMMDPTQIDQILVNLVVNARDAVEQGGRITIETRATELDEDYCEAHIGCVPGPHVALTVSDNGCGMDKDTMSKLFEPFFTTKERGKGTGLGLPTVYGIVQQNGGAIHVYSEPGKGSTFSIYLPRLEAVDMATPVTPPAAHDYSGTETVLLVEDEEPLLTLGERMLKRLGYTVLAANRPSEALRMADEFDGEIQLLLTDIVMPEMTGLDVYEKLILARPGLKCLFMSGYTADIIGYHGVLEEGLHFIQKPFTRATLGEKIREVLAPV